MGSRKREKYTFSEEDKQMIRELKNQLQMMGVPREEWSTLIQQELTLQKKIKSKNSPNKKKSGFLKFIDIFNEKVGKMINKLVMKKLSPNSDKYQDFMDGSFSGEDMSFMNSIMSGLSEKKIEELGQKGTFLVDRPDKKRMIIEFDDDEDI